jgi:hypothetical protein
LLLLGLDHGLTPQESGIQYLLLRRVCKSATAQIGLQIRLMLLS